MAHVTARLNRFLDEGDFSRETTLARVGIELQEIAAMYRDRVGSEYFAMPAYVLVGLALGYLGMNRSQLSQDQLQLLDSTCAELQNDVRLVISRPDKKLDHRGIASLFAARFVTMIRLFGDVLVQPQLELLIVIIEDAIVDTAARYFEADPDLHLTVLYTLCLDIDQFIIAADIEQIFVAIGTLHAAIDVFTNIGLRDKLAHPKRFRDKKGNRLERLVARLNTARNGGPDHDLVHFLEAAVRSDGTGRSSPQTPRH